MPEHYIALVDSESDTIICKLTGWDAIKKLHEAASSAIGPLQMMNSLTRDMSSPGMRASLDRLINDLSEATTAVPPNAKQAEDAS